MAFIARHLSLLTLLIMGAGLVIVPGSGARAQARLEASSSRHYTFDFRGVTSVTMAILQRALWPEGGEEE